MHLFIYSGGYKALGIGVGLLDLTSLFKLKAFGLFSFIVSTFSLF
jgi:hypothetical protein